MDTQRMRETLSAEREELRRRELGANADLARQADLSTADYADEARERQREGILTAISRSADSRLIQVEAALRRIDEGTYGVCVVCGGEIEEGRLAALPAADRCIDCAEATQPASPGARSTTM